MSRLPTEPSSTLHRLSGAPGGGTAERVRYHGARIALLVALAALITFAFPPTRGTNVESYRENEVAREDVIAEIPFAIPKTPAELERDRLAAMALVSPTFAMSPAVADSVVARLGRFFDRVDSAAVAGDTLRLVALLQETRITATPNQLSYLLDGRSRSTLRRGAEQAARELLPRGVVDPDPLDAVTTGSITVRRGTEEQSVPVDQVLTSRDFFTQAPRYLSGQLPPEALDLFRLILLPHLEPTLVYDVEATESDRAAASMSVPVNRGQVIQGEAIVRAAEAIGPETLNRLRAYQDALRADGRLEAELRVGPLFGAWLVTFMLLAVFGLLLLFSRPQVYANFRWLLLLAILTAAYFGAAVAIDRGGVRPEWLPVAFVALPVAVLWDTRMSLLLVLVLAAITGTLAPFASYGTVLVVMVGGAAAAMSVRAVRRRSETWVSIAIIAGAASLVGFAYGLSSGQPMAEVASGALVITGNATASALLAVGFLWVFELFTGITTEQTLLEWTDHNRPLLRRLAMEAPGTYAHTNYVANLAEAAATAIGADGLLTRVGVLYHDVGKTLKPQYFVENQPDGRNPHDKLKPETSAAIVREHVTEGVRLAREENVPEVIVRFITEHHGTQRIGFFYEKAREEAETPPDPARFSYPGPKPQSKETAIVMLADSCESAARAMQDPTPERIRDLISTIIQSKIQDGQLDESPLTIADLAEVKEKFVTVLAGVLHRRIEYPETKHLTEAEDGPREGEARATSP